MDRLYVLLFVVVLLGALASPATAATRDARPVAQVQTAGARAHVAMSRKDAVAEQYWTQAWDCHHYLAGSHESPYICIRSAWTGPRCSLFRRGKWNSRQWSCWGQFMQMVQVPGPLMGTGQVCTVRTYWTQWKRRSYHRISGCFHTSRLAAVDLVRRR